MKSGLYISLFVGAGTFIATNSENKLWKIFGFIVLLIGLFYAGYTDGEKEK